MSFATVALVGLLCSAASSKAADREFLGSPDGVVRPEWTFAAGGYGIGYAGLHVADLTGSGQRRVVAATAAGYWYVLRADGTSYTQEWVSEKYAFASLTALMVADVDGNPGQEVLVATGTRLLVYQGAVPTLKREFTTAGNAVGLNVADVDGDGALELVFAAGPTDFDGRRTLYVVDYATGAVEYRGASMGGRDVAVGNVDADPGLEIVVGTDGDVPGYLLDGASRSVKWIQPQGFGSVIRLGDLDGDGRSEIVAGASWGGIRIYDAVTRTQIGSVPVNDSLHALRLADLEGDGSLEILYGEVQSGSLHVLNGQTRAQKWGVQHNDSGMTDIAVGDANGDGRKEIFFGAGYTSSGADHLFAVDTLSRAISWQSVDHTGPFWIGAGDIDGDGATEILSASQGTDSGGGPGRWSVHDGATHRLEFMSVALPWPDRNGLNRIRSANVDADAQQEVFTNVSPSLSAGLIACYDGRFHTEQWRTPAAIGGFAQFDLGDVDGDGKLELVGISGDVVYVFDAGTGALEWQSPSLPGVGGYSSLLRIANIDADPRAEILLDYSAWTAAGILYVIDPVAATVQSMSVPPFTALGTFDPDGDGRADLLLGDENGAVWRVSGDGTSVVPFFNLGGSGVNAIAAANLDGRPGLEVVVARSDELSIHDADGAIQWRSGPKAGPPFFGMRDGLVIADLDNDGRQEILVTTDYGFQVYEVTSLPQIFVSVGDSTVSEGEGGASARFTVALSGPSSQRVSVRFGTAAGTALADADFVPVSGTLTFEPGATSIDQWVSIVGDRVYEPDETFELRLSNAEYAHLGDAVGIGTITNDDAPGLSVSSLVAREPESGSAEARFQVTLAPARAGQVSVGYSAEDGTATSPGDYLPQAGRLVFAPGEQVKVVPVTINADDIKEPAETFALSLFDALGADIVADGVGRIIDQSASLFFAVPPCRLYDSRISYSPLYSRQTQTVQVRGKCGVPDGARAVALNVTVTQANSAGHLTVAGDGSGSSATSTINFGTAQTRGNNAIVALGTSPSLTVSSGQAVGSVHFILDVAGYFE